MKKFIVEEFKNGEKIIYLMAEQVRQIIKTKEYQQKQIEENQEVKKEIFFGHFSEMGNFADIEKKLRVNCEIWFCQE